MKRFLVLGWIALACACGGSDDPAPAPEPADDGVDVSHLILDAAPAGEAQSVFYARSDAPKDEYVVEGRINNIVKGRALFNIVDLDLPYCGDRGNVDDKCKTPWDYCCEPPDKLAKSRMTVEARGDDGRPLKATDLGLRLLDVVVVKGKLEKDEHGNVTLVATGWYRKDRPELPPDLHWPN